MSELIPHEEILEKLNSLQKTRAGITMHDVMNKYLESKGDTEQKEYLYFLEKFICDYIAEKKVTKEVLNVMETQKINASHGAPEGYTIIGFFQNHNNNFSFRQYGSCESLENAKNACVALPPIDHVGILHDNNFILLGRPIYDYSLSFFKPIKFEWDSEWPNL